MLSTTLNFLKKFWARILFFALGLGSLIWFLIRVIPKPARAGYPCMKAAAPLASSFVTYILGVTSITLFFRKARERMVQSKYLLASMFIVFGLCAGFIGMMSNQYESYAIDVDLKTSLVPNQPTGTPKGVVPGRVVWEHNAAATNENCTNTAGDHWFQDDNTDQSVVSEMLANGLINLSDTESTSAAWEALFKYFNNVNGNGELNYTAGEKIAIKLNMNAIYRGDDGTNSSPQVCYALLDQLVNVVGVAQSDISIGDPNCPMTDATFDKCNADFPGVIYWGNGAGKVNAEASSSRVFYASDGSTDDYLPQAYIDATYLINVPVFKKHHRAGISVCTKNHFGSIAPYSDGGGAWHLHPSLPVPDAHEQDVEPVSDYGVYRGLVDIMGHEQLGGKTLLYLVDGLWGSTNWGHPPIKWRMSPFNNDWPNTLFLSQDPVAIESVCYDFLFEEFDENHPDEESPATSDAGPFARFEGTDDFLLQAASPSNWPNGFSYDPEGDGSVLGSLGAHEHWNNATDKRYSQNLGTGNGIELYSQHVVTSLEKVNFIPEGFEINQNYPNPFSESTTLSFSMAIPSVVELKIYNTQGQVIYHHNFFNRISGDYEYEWNGINYSGSQVPAGQYLCALNVANERGNFDMINKMLVIR